MPFWNKSRDETTSEPVRPSDSLGGPIARDLGFREQDPHEEAKPMAMLKRDDISSSAAVPNELNALLGRGSEFEGKLTFEGTVRIDGKFTGTIVTGDVLVVGEGAKISAEITCGTIIVHGEVSGNIRAKTAVEFHHPAKYRGNVETPSLMVEKGVIFEGQAKMENLSFDDKFTPAKTSGASSPTPSPIAAIKP